MSINLNCSQAWGNVKDKNFHIDHNWSSGIGGVVEKAAVTALGFKTDPTGVELNLNKDIKKICTGSTVSKIFGSFEDISCIGINNFIDNQKIPAFINDNLVKKIKSKIEDLCPKIVESCSETVCNDATGKTFTLKCEDINSILQEVVNDPQIKEMLVSVIEANLQSTIDMSKINLCDTLQILYSLGLDVPGLFLSLLNEQLKTYGIELSKDFINCICPEVTENKPLDCEDVNTIVDSVLKSKVIQRMIQSKSGIDITQKCDLLQELINSGKNPAEIISNLIKDSKYSVSQEKIEEVIKCICPDLKPPPPTPSPTPSPTPTPHSGKSVFYNKINITIMSFVFILLVIIISIVLKKFKIGIPFLNVVVLLIIFSYIAYILLEKNPRCLLKSCISSGDDWNPVPGTFKGEKSLFGITVSSQIQIDVNKNITLKELKCVGKTCPFGNLLENCKDPTITIDSNKTNFGYSVKGECIDEIYKIKTNGKQILTGLWVTQTGNNLNLNVKINAPVIGTMYINIPAQKVQ